MDRDGGEIAFAQKLVELGSTKRALDKDDDLVELELIQQLIKLAVLLTLLERDIVLLKTVEGELGVLVDVMLRRVLHELAADGLDFLRKGGREHHDLLLLGSSTEDVLNITSHI